MVSLYIDESGFMTQEHCRKLPYYVLALVRVHDSKKVKRLMKRFVSANLERLRELDKDGKMFIDGHFHELKGSALDHDMKESFFRYVCRDQIFDVFFVTLYNKKITGTLYKNRARASNFVLTLALKYFFEHNLLDKDTYLLQIDEQNIRTESRNSLEDHLNIQLTLERELADGFSITYYDSSCNTCIQLADLCANLYYSQLMTSGYSSLFGDLRKQGYIKFDFYYPLY